MYLKVTDARFKDIHSDEEKEGVSVAVILFHPKSKGTLRLVDSDPFTYPLLNPNYLAEKANISTFIRGWWWWGGGLWFLFVLCLKIF